MLPKEYRLTAEKDYARLFTKGRPFYGRGLTMKVATNRLKTPRVGFVVSTKVAKKAVVRNLIKRRMREIVRKRIPLIAGGVDIAFMAKPEAKTLTYQELETIMTTLLTKTGLMKKA
jgi:ribonuclease P protein component